MLSSLNFTVILCWIIWTGLQIAIHALLFWWLFLTTPIVLSRGPDVFTSSRLFRNNENCAIARESGENIFFSKIIFLHNHSRITLSIFLQSLYQPSKPDLVTEWWITNNKHWPLATTCYSDGDLGLTPAPSHDGARAGGSHGERETMPIHREPVWISVVWILD